MKRIRTGQRFSDRAWFALERARGIPIETDLRRYIDFARSVRAAADPAAVHESDDALVGRFAAVVRASRCTLGLDPYEEQIVAGLVLHEGKLAQMQTGEGKTLAAVFAAAAAAAHGETVHVLTANDYLARRDAGWMAPVYEALGATVGWITQHSSDDERRSAYRCAVTYLTAEQAGFDYLRDEIQYERNLLLQRGHATAIVDEADFILIDEARSPLVLATADISVGVDPLAADRVARTLEPGLHFVVDRTGRRCGLTLEGWREVDAAFGIDPAADEDTARHARAAVHVALHAHHLLRRDADYILRSETVELVDEATGRIAERRRWPHGIQRALEVKEGLDPRPEGRISGSITVRDYVSLYDRLAGMTATAVPAAREFSAVHDLATVIIPPHAPDRTVHLRDRLFATREAKLRALVAEVASVHESGRPILVGTRTIAESEEVAALLRARGVTCRVLNATQDAEEAALVAQAGLRGAVTVATNMAGRGTDIALGGANNHDEVAALGGLFVMGTNRHESVRIDLQLRGRAGRQGDPGTTQFFVSLDDDLVRRYAITDLIPAAARETVGEIDDSVARHEIERAQSIIEEQHASMRGTLRDYTRLVEQQRRVVSRARRAALLHMVVPDEVELATESALDRWREEGREIAGLEVRSRLWMAGIDESWADHLALAEDVQEGIHLQRLGHQNPLLVFVRTMSDAFETARKRAAKRTILRFDELSRNPAQFTEPQAAVPAPASTWTYFTSDDPFPEFRVSLVSAANPAGALVAAALAATRLFTAPFDLVRRTRRRARSRRQLPR